MDTVIINKIDWDMWKQSKQEINELIATLEPDSVKRLRFESIRNFLDYVEDEMVASSVDKEDVYIPTCDDCGETLRYDIKGILYCPACTKHAYLLTYYCKSCDMEWDKPAHQVEPSSCPECYTFYEPEKQEKLTEENKPIE